MASYLLDTHAALWWWSASPKLGRQAGEVIGFPESVIFVSAASAWEIATKYRLGKLDDIGNPQSNYARLMAANGFASLAVIEAHAMTAGLLPGEHRDPFDRLIAAQALVEGHVVITRDPAFVGFGCDVIW